MKRTNVENFSRGFSRVHALPVLVWLAAVAFVVVLFYHRTQRFEILGFAQGQVRQISAPCDGRLKTVSVELFEKVSKGQILATLDGTQLNAQIATIFAEIQHLMSQLVPTQETMLADAGNLENDMVAAQRLFSVDVENAKLRILELNTVIETDRVMLEDLELEVKIAQELLDKDAIAPYQLQKAQAAYDALEKKTQTNQQLLTETQNDLEQAQRRRDEFAERQPFHPLIDSTLEPIHKQIAIQEKLIDELLVQRNALTIRSPIDGVVVQIQATANQAALRRPGEGILRRPGEVVLAGDPILIIAETEPKDIVTYASAVQLSRIQEGKPVELVKNTEPAQIAHSQVCYVGPVVEQLPIRLWRNPNIPEWGRPLLIKIPPGMKLVPGELVGIRGL